MDTYLFIIYTKDGISIIHERKNLLDICGTYKIVID